MKKLLLLVGIVLVLVSAGCGGGGGGGGTSVTLTGTVSDVVLGIPAPAALVEGGSTSTTTSTVDGSFSISVPSGTTSLRVSREGGSTPVVFTYTFAAAKASGSVGELWIGPSQITVTGKAVDSTSLSPISGATVTLGGISGTTAATGIYTVTGVPYAASSQFPSLPGSITATGYISAPFEPGTSAVVGGTLTLPDIGLVPSNTTAPPGTPYNIWGRVSPLKASPGATVTLSLGGTPFRTATVGSAGTYYFWVPAGTYTINVSQTGYSAPTITATLTATNQVLEEDVTLTPS